MPDKPEETRPPDDGETTLVRLNAYLYPRQFKKLADLQHATGASMSHHLRDAIDAFKPVVKLPKR